MNRIEQVNNQYHEELLRNQEAENIVDNTLNENEVSFSQEALSKSDNEQESLNDLKEFGVDTNEPDLFSSENQSLNSEDSIISPDVEEEDDLEIPAFLRRQKN